LGEQWQNCLSQHSFNTVSSRRIFCFVISIFVVFQVDISASIAYLLSIKDAEELALMKKACEITGKLYSKQLKDQIVNTVASEHVSFL